MEQRKKLDCKNARNISILAVLEKLGHKPQRENAKEAWYLSPVRSENKASFLVAKHLNRWYDHGIGRGGNVIDLICLMMGVEVKEALRILSGEHLVDVSEISVSQKQPKEPKNILLGQREISHPALVAYLQRRKIPLKLAKEFCSEVKYRNKRKTHFSIGMQNRSGGWELRNKYFKGSISPKDFSFFTGNNNKLVVVEGMFDMLSLLTIVPKLGETHDLLILNSTAFVEKAVPVIKKYRVAQLFLDNDEAGRTATGLLLKEAKHSIDHSYLYKDEKDLNEHLSKRENRPKRSAIQDVSLCTQRPSCFSPKGRKGRKP